MRLINMLKKWTCGLIVLILMVACSPDSQTSGEPENKRLKVLFLGDDEGHRPAERLRDVASPMLDRGIELFYTSELNDLNLENLRKYDALLLYANYHDPHHTELSREKEDALLDYVAGGGGFVPVHSASGNFRNSERFIELLGG
ncbi:MAG: ThuA domain-containing protein, partial [Balneolales bacterium]